MPKLRSLTDNCYALKTSKPPLGCFFSVLAFAFQKTDLSLLKQNQKPFFRRERVESGLNHWQGGKKRRGKVAEPAWLKVVTILHTSRSLTVSSRQVLSITTIHITTPVSCVMFVWKSLGHELTHHSVTFDRRSGEEEG